MANGRNQGGDRWDDADEEAPTYSIDRRTVLQTTGTGLAGLAAFSETTTAQSTSGGDLIWEFETGGNVLSSPTVVDGTVYIGSSDGSLYAIDANLGELTWKFETGDSIGRSSPVVVDETVYIGSDNLYAIDTELGELIWEFETGGKVLASPTVVDETVFCSSDLDTDHNLYAVGAESGDEQWSSSLSELYYDHPSAPTVVDGTVFLGSEDDHLYAVDAESGNEQWSCKIRDDSIGAQLSSPTVMDGTVFVGSTDGSLYAVDVESGDEEWAFETEKEIVSSPTATDGTVFVGSTDGSLYAVDVESGDEEWAFETEKEIFSSPTVVDGQVFVEITETSEPPATGLYSINVESGDEEWAVEHGLVSLSSPTVVDGTLFVGGLDNNVYALDAGVEGSSEGSRVNLGTLGHHNVFAENGPTPPGETGGSELDPAFTMSPEDPIIYDPIEFDASDSEAAESNIVEYRWDFTGNGEVDRTGKTSFYTFKTQSEHEVTLTIVDENGGEASTTKTLEFSGFTPAIHGFGFGNWGGYDLLSFTQITSRIDDFIQSQLSSVAPGISEPPGFKLGLALFIEQGMEGIGWANGHCLGMVLTSRRYYNTEIPSLPAYDRPVETARDIQVPNSGFGDDPTIEDVSELGPVETDIDTAQSDQLFDTEYILRHIAATYAPDKIDDDGILREIDDQLSQGSYPELILPDTLFTGHSVLAYAIEGQLDDDESILVHIYDPNYSSSQEMEFQANSSTGEYSFEGYERYDTVYVSSEVDPDYDLLGSTSAATAVSNILTDYIVIGINGERDSIDAATTEARSEATSPVEVSVTAPDGTELSPIDIPPEELQATFGYEQVVADFETSGTAYDIGVSADEATTYEVDVQGSRADGGVIDASVSERISEGETRTATATIPETEGEEGGVSEPVPGESDRPGVADYAGDNDVVETPGLLNAISDWRDDEIETPLLLDVIETWRSGNPVS